MLVSTALFLGELFLIDFLKTLGSYLIWEVREKLEKLAKFDDGIFTVG